MTHIKNAESFSRLVDFCTGYGGTYNPGRQSLRIEALIAQRQQVNNAFGYLHSAKSQYDNQVNQRKQVFDQLPKLVSSILRTLEASGASPEKLNDARSFAHQITGYITRDSAPVATVAATQPADAPKVRHSSMQLAFTSKTDTFAKLINAVSSEPLYLTNEPNLSTTGLTNKLNLLITFNQLVSNAHVSWSNARIDRNAVLYTQSQSAYTTSLAVKKYVRAIYGPGSEQFAQIKNLSLIKSKK